jgi:hypothetical protein
MKFLYFSRADGSWRKPIMEGCAIMAIKRKAWSVNQIPKEVIAELGARRGTTDSAALLASLIRQWGGTDALAISIRDEFNAAPKGGMARQRILEMLTRMVVTTTDKEHVKKVQPSDMSDDELHKFAAAYIQKFAGQDNPNGLEDEGPQG